MINKTKYEKHAVMIFSLPHGKGKFMSKIDARISEIDLEIAEYQEMITYSIQTNNKQDLAMWRRALQTAKLSKRRLANL